MAIFEHINITVPDAPATADALVALFGWHIRWQGAAINGGFTVHVGDAERYLALYTPKAAPNSAEPRYSYNSGLNHIGVVVPDLKAAEARVVASGFTPHSHYDYEPGERFYFDGPDGVEFEVVCYA